MSVDRLLIVAAAYFVAGGLYMLLGYWRINRWQEVQGSLIEFRIVNRKNNLSFSRLL